MSISSHIVEVPLTILRCVELAVRQRAVIPVYVPVATDPWFRACPDAK